MTGNDTFKGDILIVDDVPDTQVAVRARLRRQGYHVREAFGGKQALALVREKTPDLILLDIRMADMDGPELSSRLKADENEDVRNIPVIFISAYAMESDKINAFAHGGVDFVTKPASAAEVVARVETHLAIRRAQRQLQEQNAQLEAEINRRILAEQELRQHSRRMESLHAVMNALVSSLSLNEVLDIILEQLSLVIPLDSASIFLAENGHLIGVAGRGLPYPEQIIDQTFPAEGLFRLAASQKRPFYLEDAQADPRYYGWGGTDYTRGWIGAPLIIRDKIIGYMTIDNRQMGAYGRQHAALVQPIAAQAAQAIENARLHERVRRDAVKLEDRVYERTETLNKIVSAMAGRELRMIELKEVINKLRDQLLEAGLEPVADDPLMAGLDFAVEGMT